MPNVKRMVLCTSTNGDDVYFRPGVLQSSNSNPKLLLLLKMSRSELLLCTEPCELGTLCCLKIAGCCEPCNCCCDLKIQKKYSYHLNTKFFVQYSSHQKRLPRSEYWTKSMLLLKPLNITSVVQAIKYDHHGLNNGPSVY